MLGSFKKLAVFAKICIVLRKSFHETEKVRLLGRNFSRKLKYFDHFREKSISVDDSAKMEIFMILKFREISSKFRIFANIEVSVVQRAPLLTLSITYFRLFCCSCAYTIFASDQARRTNIVFSLSFVCTCFSVSFLSLSSFVWRILTMDQITNRLPS